MDATEYMLTRPRGAAVEEADRHYSDAIARLRAAVPVAAVGLVLAAEEAATAWGVSLAHDYFRAGLELGLYPNRLNGQRLDLGE